jgi:hypothetical protein
MISRLAPLASGLETVDFRGELEVFFGEEAGVMGPGFDIHAAPGERNIGVMALGTTEAPAFSNPQMSLKSRIDSNGRWA